MEHPAHLSRFDFSSTNQHVEHALCSQMWNLMGKLAGAAGSGIVCARHTWQVYGSAISALCEFSCSCLRCVSPAARASSRVGFLRLGLPAGAAGVPAISQPLDGDWLELWLLWMQTLFWCCGQHWRIIYVNCVSFSSVNVHKMGQNERRIGQRNTCKLFIVPVNKPMELYAECFDGLCRGRGYDNTVHSS